MESWKVTTIVWELPSEWMCEMESVLCRGNNVSDFQCDQMLVW